MYIVAACQHSLYAELLVSEIENYGIPREQIAAIPLDRRNEKLLLFDTMHHADGHSMIDLALMLGTILMLLGSIYGFVLPLGPIIWALIGLLAGGMLGFAIKWLFLKRRGYKISARKGNAELIIMVNCDAAQEKDIEEICWHHNALGVGKLND